MHTISIFSKKSPFKLEFPNIRIKAFKLKNNLDNNSNNVGVYIEMYTNSSKNTNKYLQL